MQCIRQSIFEEFEKSGSERARETPSSAGTKDLRITHTNAPYLTMLDSAGAGAAAVAIAAGDSAWDEGGVIKSWQTKVAIAGILQLLTALSE